MLSWEKLSDQEKELVLALKGALGPETVTKFVKKTTFSPSKIVYSYGGCPRFWNFMFSGVETTDTIEFKNYRAMESGTAAHESIQKKLDPENSGIDIIIEQELTNQDPPIRAFADGVVKLLDGSTVPLEIKTTSDQGYEARNRHFKGAEYNILQLLVYMKIVGSNLGLLLYENRNDFENLVIPVFMDEKNSKIVDDAFQWMREVRAAWTDAKMPTYFSGRRVNSKICKSCPVKKQCDAAGEGVVMIPLLKDFNK